MSWPILSAFSVAYWCVVQAMTLTVFDLPLRVMPSTAVLCATKSEMSTCTGTSTGWEARAAFRWRRVVEAYRTLPRRNGLRGSSALCSAMNETIACRLLPNGL